MFDNAADNTAERFLMLTKHYINLSRNTTAKTRLLKTNMNTIPAEASGTDQKAANREATYAILKCRCQGQYITAATEKKQTTESNEMREVRVLSHTRTFSGG